MPVNGGNLDPACKDGTGGTIGRDLHAVGRGLIGPAAKTGAILRHEMHQSSVACRAIIGWTGSDGNAQGLQPLDNSRPALIRHIEQQSIQCRACCWIEWCCMSQKIGWAVALFVRTRLENIAPDIQD